MVVLVLMVVGMIVVEVVVVLVVVEEMVIGGMVGCNGVGRGDSNSIGVNGAAGPLVWGWRSALVCMVMKKTSWEFYYGHRHAT